MSARNRRAAFTLIEVLLVVVIMAILAATVVPSFTDSSTDAKESTLSFNLHTLRAQIELYKMHHDGEPPAELEDLTKVDDDGFGPYLTSGVPFNPITNTNTTASTGATPESPPDAPSGGEEGWLYNATTGNVWANSDPGFTL